MSEEQIVLNCAPTLSGIKPGNLFSAGFTSKEELNDQIRMLNRLLNPKGVRVIPLRISEGRVLIYVYRPARLQAYFHHSDVEALLRNFGYKPDSTGNCIAALSRKLRNGKGGQKSFPHEVGLFLGYPAEDVRGFIENKAGGYKCIGCWKVYGDLNKAEKTFNEYKRCTNRCVSLYEQGTSIDQLTIAETRNNP